MNIKKQVRAALAVAVSSTLLIPGYVVAAEKPAQPGTVRPADKAVAQPGTDKQARSISDNASNSQSTAQPGTDKVAPKPAPESAAPKPAAPVQPSVPAKPQPPAPQAPQQPAVESVPVQQPSAPAPTPNYSDVTAQNSVPTGEQTLAEQATETTASQSVRESASGTEQPAETQPVRTTQADEKARFEVASAVESGGDVREDTTKQEQAVTREDENAKLAPVQAPDGGPDNDGEDAPEPTNDILNQTINAGATVEGAAGDTTLEFDASPVATTFSANSGSAAVSATVDHAAKQITVEAGNATFEAQAPAAVTQAVEQIVPPQVQQAVDQAAQQAQAVINTHLASLPNGEQVTETAIGQVATWFHAE